MEKLLTIISILLISATLQGQFDVDFKKIDKYALKAPQSIETSIPDLSTYLTAPYNNNLAKVRSIFTWITHHIDYDYKAYKDGKKRLNQSNQNVLIRKKAVCFGYATLFKALCEAANIKSEVVSGYSKQQLGESVNLEAPDHAWNAVKINEKWYLLDATWASNIRNKEDDWMRKFNSTYFLPKPTDFIFNHLPSDPMWQLLVCPITVKTFNSDFFIIKNALTITENCINYTDTLLEYEQLQVLQKRLTSEARAYRFHPTTQTAKEYAHTLMDYKEELASIAESLQDAAAFNLDSLILVQKEMLRICKKAASLTALYPNQLQGWAFARMNYAIALSRKINTVDVQQQAKILKTMEFQALEAKKILEQLPSNMMIEGALSNCEQILEYLKK